MKSLRINLFAPCLAVALLVPAGAAPEKTIRLRPDHEGLAAQRADGPIINGTKLAALPVEPGTDKEQQPGLLERSTLLAFNGYWTMVPKRAVLHLPESLRSRVVIKPSGKLLSWNDFYARNRGWLHLQNVRYSDASGKTALDAGVFETHRSLGRIVVAVCEGGPISMPPRPQAQASL